jgi:hypothetical protein
MENLGLIARCHQFDLSLRSLPPLNIETAYDVHPINTLAIVLFFFIFDFTFFIELTQC